jgi:hypothetical protein
VNAKSREIDVAARAAMVCAAVMIANQVAGKAARDAIFLSTYEITDLPTMLIGAAIVSIVVVLLTTRLLTRFGPGRVVPLAFALSAVLLLGEWALIAPARKVAAVAVYLHLAVFGAVLISGFWSVINERFDPRTARRRMSRIAGGATLGGLLGGILAERVAAWSSVATMLPLLALMHLTCAALVLRIRQPESRDGVRRRQGAAGRSGLAVLAEVPYLRSLAAFVLLGTLAAGLVDYVFKAEATAYYGASGEELMRFFAVFYTVTGLATFAVQSAFGRAALERLGLARTAATVPGTLLVGSLGVVAIPGLALVTVVRGLESVLRSSLFRSAYELLYTPVSAPDKRASKTIIDVGFDRLGDAAAGGVIRGVLLIVPQAASLTLVLLVAALSGLALFIVRRIQRGYVSTLEARLVERAVELDLDEDLDVMSSGALMQTLAAVDLKEVVRAAGGSQGMLTRIDDLRKSALQGLKTPPAVPSAPPVSSVHTGPGLPRDPVVERIAELRSGDATRVLATLDSGEQLTPALVPHVVSLLAWEDVHERAVIALRAVAPRFVGQLVDALTDPDEEFAIRRRLPRVLSGCPSARCIDGLLVGLEDKRFEVRFQCGLALATIHRRSPHLEIDRARVHAAVLRETRVGRRVWETQRLLDETDAGDGTLFEDALIRQRSTRSLEHVFTLLSLVLPTEPLKIAYRGLHTADRALRGTALEYLESVLPGEIRAKLWPFLEVEEIAGPVVARDRDEALAALLRSNKSIEMNLAALRRRPPGRE